jgi:glycosyltransferase involved in cell wall biosynthesis
MNPPEVAVIGTAPHGFAGAGTIHCKVSALLAQIGYEVTLVTWKPPYRHDELTRAGVQVHVPEIVSDAFPHSDALRALVAVREVLAHSRAAVARGKKVVLIGTYLFPFYAAIEKASALLAAGGVAATSIAIPSGSDVWQVGVQVPELAHELLASPHTHLRVTYSRRFAAEIAAWFGECGAFEIIPPPVDVQAFQPASDDERRLIRRRLDISDDALVLLNCSNMRPVKGLDQTVRIAREFAAASSREVLLLLVGPITPSLKDCLGIPDDREVRESEVVKTGALAVRLEGLQPHTRDYHAIADVALNTSYHDSFNLSLAESLACGTPVVSSDVVGIREIMNGVRAGHFFSYSGRAAASSPGAARTLTRAQSDGIVRALMDMTKKEALLHFRDDARLVVVRNLEANRVAARWDELIRDRVEFRARRTGVRSRT